MRPVYRGNTPLRNGVAKTVSKYTEWRKDLIDRIGPYCCYCNLPLYSSPDVEHVLPKSTNPALKLEWSNMLLACAACNRAKWDTEVDALSYYLPDFHNTHLAFDYIAFTITENKQNRNVCIPVPKNLPVVNQAKALNTISLFKLQSTLETNKATDLRWKYRYEAWWSASEFRRDWDDFGHTKSDRFIQLLVMCATGKGFFSVWFDAFKDVDAVKEALIKGFTGTDVPSFDSANHFEPVIRSVGDL